MDKLKALFSKKIGKIPVVYILGILAVGLAYYAWKLKPTNTTPTDTDTTDTTPADDTADESAYSGLGTSGTVVVQPQTPTQATTVTETNETWGQAATAYLIAEGTAPGDAQTAILLYLQGANLSYDQGQLRDKAIKKLGLPPEPLETIGTVSPAPAQKQFSVFPGKHVVKGSVDNTASKLAALYYGNGDALHTNEIVAANFSLGPVGTTYNPGTTIVIPAWGTPKYFTATSKARYAYQIASASKVPGLTSGGVMALNPTVTFPVNVGAKVRVE